MEEHIGLWWHRFVTHLADTSYPQATIHLTEMNKRIGLLFRAAGGDHGTRVAPVALTRHTGPRGWLQKIAGSGQRVALPRLDAEVLALPETLAVFPDPAQNQALYLWLATMAAVYEPSGDWLADNRAATARALQRFPGLRARHAALVEAHLRQRPRLDSLPPEQACAEAAVQAALRGEDHAPVFLQAQQVAPVWLWLTSEAVATTTAGASRENPGDHTPGPKTMTRNATRRRARRVDPSDPRPALLLPSKVESILTWSDFVKLDRGSDDEDDLDSQAVADDMDTLSVTADGARTAARVRFDLDLPAAAQDDLPLGPGLLLPEWDWRRRQLLPGHCALHAYVARPAAAYVPPAALRVVARQVRRRLESLQPAQRWCHRQERGDALDTDAWVDYRAECCSGLPGLESPRVYTQRHRVERSLATLLLADLSLSTDAYTTSDARVIDVIRDALYVFGEALTSTGDAFEMLGFSSIRRQHVRMQHLKGFEENWSETVRARIGAIKPGYYTRMGAALRGATQRLAARPEHQRLLLVLTDGKPNDLDLYEGRYGLEDSRHAVQEARAAGLLPFCVTIDEQAHDYMPLLFGRQGYALVRRPQELAQRLTQVWAQLVR